jgi:hypothetical protein
MRGRSIARAIALTTITSTAVVVTACGADGDTLPVADLCNPLGGNHCMTPWPSSAFEVDDATTATGRRLALVAEALPITENRETTDPAIWNQADGFSASAPIVLSFDGGVSPANLADPMHIDASLTDASPTLIVDMTTGQRVAHFAELDVPAEATPDHQALYLRPAARLIGGHRYAVAIRTSLKRQDGGDLPVSAGMRALVTGAPTTHPLLEKMRPRFADVLAAVGVPPDQLVVAWDFTVASDAYVRRDATAARDRAVAALDGKTQAFTILSDTPIDDGQVIARKITGTFETPLLLTNDGRFVDRTILARDADGLPAVQGLYRAPFTAIVPRCAYTSPAPVGMILYGHGLLGTSDQVASGPVRATAVQLCMVVVGTDMRGMSASDIGAVARALTGLTYSDEVFEVQVQGIVNHIALARAMRTSMAASLFVDAANGNKVLVDPAKVYYYGLSQGGIFGATVMAYDPTITRGVLGVGAADYALMLERSADWPTYKTILQGAYPDPLDVVLNMNLMQNRWDKSEPSGIANVLTAGTATGVPPKQILLQIAVGDEQVPNLASEWEARTAGFPVLGPSVKLGWGLTAMTTPLAGGSALVYYDGGAPAPPITNVPAPDTGQHDLTRNQPAARRQMGIFYATGMIVDECKDAGACFCADGKCD